MAVPIALGVAALGGALYGFIPGFLKARTGAHEVVTTIMLNNIAGFVLAWAVADVFKQPGASFPRTGDIGNAALPILFGRNLHAGVLLALAAIVVVKFILDRTTLGFEIRTVGANPNAARYAGISPILIITLTMSLSGLLAGLAGGDPDPGPDRLLLAGPHRQRRIRLDHGCPLGYDRRRSESWHQRLLFGVFRAGQGRMQTNTTDCARSK